MLYEVIEDEPGWYVREAESGMGKCLCGTREDAEEIAAALNNNHPDNVAEGTQ